MGTGNDMGKPAVSRRKFLRSLAGLTGASLLAACGGTAPATTGGGTAASTTGGGTAAPGQAGTAQATVEWWDTHTGVDQDVRNKMIEAFQSKNPDIKINRTYIAQSETSQANDKLLTAIAGGAPPDLFRFDRFIVAQFAAQGFLTDLTDLATKAGVKQEDYFPFAWEEANYKGKLYALPDDTDTRALWFNQDAFKEVGLDPNKPPQNIKELEEYADKLTKKDSNGRITRWGFMPIADQAWIYTYGFAWKGEFQDKATGKITSAHPKVVESMQWLQSYANKAGIENMDAFYATCISGAQCRDQNDYFWTGQSAMVISGDWKVSQAKKYKPEGHFGVAPFPGPEGPAAYASWAGGWSWVIPKGAKNPEAAWKVISWVCGPEGQDMYCKGTFHIPTNQKTAKDPFYSEDPLHKVFMDLLPVSHTRPPIPAGSLLWEELVKARSDIYHGKAPDQALKAVDDKVNAELEKLGYFKKS
jgi:ABC-type glycerol-3-phosphate transport system substrate-binding protein